MALDDMLPDDGDRSVPEEVPSLPFGSFHPQLESVATAIKNKIHLEWPKAWDSEGGGPTMLRASVAVALNTYRTVVFICTESAECGRKIEFTLSCTPLARTVLDGVFAVTYLLEDMPRRADIFWKGGWREIKEELERYQKRYGDDPAWGAWLVSFEGFVEGSREDLGVEPSEAADLRKTLPYWPIPSQMLKDSTVQQEQREFLQFLSDWFYRELSADSHMSMPGLARRSTPLIEGDTKGLEKHRSDCVMVTAVLLLALLSEVQRGAKWPDTRPRLEYVWTMLGSIWETAKEVYEMRYKGRL